MGREVVAAVRELEAERAARSRPHIGRSSSRVVGGERRLGPGLLRMGEEVAVDVNVDVDVVAGSSRGAMASSRSGERAPAVGS